MIYQSLLYQSLDAPPPPEAPPPNPRPQTPPPPQPLPPPLHNRLPENMRVKNPPIPPPPPPLLRRKNNNAITPRMMTGHGIPLPRCGATRRRGGRKLKSRATPLAAAMRLPISSAAANRAAP